MALNPEKMVKRKNMQPEPSSLMKKVRISPRSWTLLGYTLDVIGIIMIIMALIFPFYLFLPAWSHKDGTFNINPQSKTYTDYHFYIGGIIRGMVLMQDSGNSSITITIIYPKGETIISPTGDIMLGPSIITGRYIFEFQTKETGLYKVILNNQMNASISIYIIIWQYYYNVLFACLGTGFFICGLIMVVDKQKHKGI
jgi:hypothetical protein